MNVKGLGPQRVRQLVSYFKNPQLVFKASKSELCKVEGVDLKLANIIHSYKEFDFGNYEMERAEKVKSNIVTFWDDEFPALLRKIYDPPVVLYTKGTLLKNREDCIGVVGTRGITSYGKKTTVKIVKELAGVGISIVSGLARGVDSAAHRETLKAGGRTLAVLGNGIDFVYPPENNKLAEEISENGVVISEFPIGTNPDAGNFPQRNRIISGLSHGLLVVEAGNRSGAILTALNAIDQNRDVFAVPGRITDKMSIGTNRLIKNGAIPVKSGEEILNIVKNRLFKPLAPRQQTIRLNLTDEERILVEMLGDHPLHIDEIVELAQLDITKALSMLLQLELKGAVIQLSGKQFARA